MDFGLTESQRIVADTLGAFARDVMAPAYMATDRAGVFPRAMWGRMADMGLFGLRVPEDCGGQGADCVTAGLAIEQAARGDFNLCYGILNSCFAGELLGRFAQDAVRRDWLGPMAAGQRILSVALTEPQGGSDAAAIRTRAVRAEGGYVLTGEKASVTLVMAADAAIVFAKTDPAAGARGVSAFLVPLDRPGITRTPYSDMGSRGIVRGALFLDGVAVPESHRIGPENEAFSKVMSTFDHTRALIGLMCLGAAQMALEDTIRYTRERMAFGKPLSANQGVSFPIAEWAGKLEMARWLCLRTLWLRDAGLPHTAEAAMCKMLVPEMCVGAIQDCLVLHGHYGYTQDFPVEQRLRDVMGQIIADGTPQIQKLIVARHLFGRQNV